MRDLNRNEVVAMWLWGKEYSESRLSAIDWYRKLSQGRKRLVGDFMQEYENARERDLPSSEPRNG